jgi:hypothetical protein
MSSRMHVLKDPCSDLLDQWWMENDVSTDLVFIGLANLIPCNLSITTTLCFNLLPSPTKLQTFNGWSLKVMWVMYKWALPI